MTTNAPAPPSDESDLSEALLRLYEHMTVKELAKELHIHTNKVRELLLRNGVTLRRRGRYARCEFTLTEEVFDAVCRDGIRTVARRIGLSYLQLHRHLRSDPRVAEWSKARGWSL